MNRIVLDDQFTNQLRPVIEPSEVFDSAGNQLGFFLPKIDPELYAGVNPSVGKEELERRVQAGGGRKLSEILADLEKNHR